MKFLSKDNYHKEVEHFFSNNESLDIAVAFWGIDALSLFKSISGKIIRIICNLESSACNPFLIKKLMDYKNITLKTNSRLHAKVLLQEHSVIIGSANVSANGLSFEGDELDGWFEAGVLTKDNSIIENTSIWFLNLWDASEEITDKSLFSALKKWKKRRSQRDVKKHKMSLINAAKHDLENFKDREIYFVIYRNDNLTPEAVSKLEDVKQAFSALTERIECYEGWSELPDGAYLIDIYLGLNKDVQINGVYWTPDDPIVENFKYKDGSTGVIKICFKKKSIFGYKITAKDKKIIKSHVADLWNYNSAQLTGIIPFAEGMEILKEVSNQANSADAKSRAAD